MCRLFTLFDDLCSVHNCHKIETAGDCYIACSGMLLMDEDDFLTVSHCDFINIYIYR